MTDLYCLTGPLLRLLDAETAHSLAIKALASGLVPTPRAFEDPVLGQTLWGRAFANPVGLAAGFDKNAQVTDAMLGQGFGFVEVGSVTPRPQPGNPRPRLFRLTADGAVINRMGFNNDGMDAVAKRLRSRRAGGIIGVNLGKNKDTEDAAYDYAKGVLALAPLADYLVVNVSSPNTPGLRALQGREPLSDLLQAALAARTEATPDNPPPLLLKIAPDLTDEDKSDIAQVVLELGIDGLIATNTTIARPDGLLGPSVAQTGGLSGKPLMEPSTRMLADMYRLTDGKLPLIGVGGIASGDDAYRKIRAGASLVQLYSALVYQGPGLVNRIKRRLVELLKADGFDSISDAVGADTRR
ncbi:MAG: quinone-dependent dihydroorotate dehydrogenase [Rhodospirillaceae bacterium]|nr:quinone-dependent dihydroorotate dehydrogenase [Rhodospirillaceae bacterium]MBT4219391.1 quinone-dependent dihydroorotate dehydrogenase [Rhodospirillaceae bacterium]MBT5308696.1 quinone-dependent dihydroorotate dehydrogenase [Rhodospirillaceae bacterium]MBT6407307.1 quinone-dependent dihydroorotate dehydrogenase [Rhodospirillaceae bacterium]MBT7356635.1 quinone-dependent dihydroorotate dehydrogenase [Rhodospirillaceae bacterium]